MKKFIVMVLIASAFTYLDAKGPRRSTLPLLEIGPKASLYIYEHFDLGIAVELVCNPIRNIGIRLDAAELRFGHATSFNANYISSLDGLFYIPMRGIEPYVHAGLGLYVVDTDAGDNTSFNMRFGMGFLFPINARTNFFIEPGILVEDHGDDTNAIFRLSFGARFGIL